MASAGTISFQLTGETAQYQKALAQVTASMGNTGKAATKLGDTISSKLGAAMSGVAITGFAKKAMDAAKIQVEAEQRLAGAIRATGAAISQSGIQQYAAELQKVTTFGDEATISAAAMLVPFGMTEDQIKSMLPKLQDFSTAMGTDLGMAAKLFGRAVASGQADLSRYGVTLSDAQKEIMKTGDASERAAMLTEMLDSKFGGMAENLAKTDFGKAEQAMNSMGDTMEEIGKEIIPAVASGLKAINVVIQAFTAGVRVLGAFAGGGLTAVREDFDAIFGDFETALGKKTKEDTEQGVSKGVKEGISKGVKALSKEGLKVDVGFDFGGVALREAEEFGQAIADAFLKDLNDAVATMRQSGMAHLAGPIGPSRTATMSTGSDALKNIEAMDAERQARIDSVNSITQYSDQMGEGFAAAGNIAKGAAEGGFKGAMVAMAMEAVKNSEAMQALNKAFNELMGSLGELMDAFGPLIDVWTKSVGTVSDSLSWGADKIGGAVDSVAGWLGIGEDAIEREKRTREQLIEGMKNSPFFQGLDEQMTDLRTKNLIAGGDFSGLSDSTLEGLQTITENWIDSLEDQLLREEVLGLDTSETKERIAVFTESLSGISGALEDGSDILKDTTDGMSEALTNVPQGLKINLMRYNNALAAGAPQFNLDDGYTLGRMGQQTIVHINGQILVEGTQDFDSFMEQLSQRAEESGQATDGITAGSRQGTKSTALGK